MGTRLPAQNPAPVPAWKSDEGSPLFYAGIQMNLCGQMSQCCNFVQIRHKHRILNGYFDRQKFESRGFATLILHRRFLFRYRSLHFVYLIAMRSQLAPPCLVNALSKSGGCGRFFNNLFCCIMLEYRF